MTGMRSAVSISVTPPVIPPVIVIPRVSIVEIGVAVVMGPVMAMTPVPSVTAVISSVSPMTPTVVWHLVGDRACVQKSKSKVKFVCSESSLHLKSIWSQINKISQNPALKFVHTLHVNWLNCLKWDMVISHHWQNLEGEKLTSQKYVFVLVENCSFKMGF